MAVGYSGTARQRIIFCLAQRRTHTPHGQRWLFVRDSTHLGEPVGLAPKGMRRKELDRVILDRFQDLHAGSSWQTCEIAASLFNSLAQIRFRNDAILTSPVEFEQRAAHSTSGVH